MNLGLRIADPSVSDSEIYASLPVEHRDWDEEKWRERERDEYRVNKQRRHPPSGLENVVFILAALKQVGKALFPEEWKDYLDAPRATSFDRLPPEAEHASSDSLHRAEEHLSKYAKELSEQRIARGTYEEIVMPRSHRDPLRRDERIHRRFVFPPWSNEEWAVALEIDRQLQASAARYWHMAHITRQTLAKLLMSGEVESYACSIDGGDLIFVNKAAWNTQYWWRRFWLGRVDYEEPHNGNALGSHWLLVDQAGLDNFIKALQRRTPTPEQAVFRQGYRSRFMQFMDELIVDMGITDENQPLHKEIVCRAIELWNKNGYGEGMSEQTAKQMATLVRQPDGKKGKAKRALSPSPVISGLPNVDSRCREKICP